MSRPTAKRCPRCGQVKPAGAFYRRRGGRRLSPYCQLCTRPPRAWPASSAARTRPQPSSCEPLTGPASAATAPWAARAPPVVMQHEPAVHR
jgi:hypothetical protein